MECTYSPDGYLTSINPNSENRITFTYQNGNLISITERDDDLNMISTITTTFQYGLDLNKSGIMPNGFENYVGYYGAKSLFQTGLLGKPSKYLPISGKRTYSDSNSIVIQNYYYTFLDGYVDTKKTQIHTDNHMGETLFKYEYQ